MNTVVLVSDCTSVCVHQFFAKFVNKKVKVRFSCGGKVVSRGQ